MLVRQALSLSSRRAFSTSPRRAAWDKISLHPEVADALQTHKPVVALETAILTHGMPFPYNLEVTLGLSKIIRDAGAIPATIALVDGVPKVGLTKEELTRLADPSFPAVKVSRRDLAPAMALRKDGGTTVAGTMYLARQAGVDLFVTGGIGGVHRGGETSLDVSADLTELGRTPLAVVCAGCKSILDIGRTIEYLETQGVTIANYGATTDFPAFYTPKSGFQVPWNVRDASEAAAVIHAGLNLPVPLSTLLTVPIPDSWAASGERIQEAVEQAVRDLEQSGVRGKECTPWLLARVAELTKGSAVKSNVALIENNARVGAEVAIRLAELKRKVREEAGVNGDLKEKLYAAVGLGGTGTVTKNASSSAPASSSAVSTPSSSSSLPAPEVIIFGSAAVDLTSTAGGRDLAPHTTHPGKIALSLGGVGANMAVCASRLSPKPEDVLLVAPRGDDALGRILSDEMKRVGLRVDGLKVVGGGGGEVRTAACSLVLDCEGGLESGVADMEIVEGMKGDDAIAAIGTHRPALVGIDGNLSSSTIASIVSYCSTSSIPTFFEPTSLPKSLRILPALKAGAKISYVSPNILELRHIYKAIDEAGLMERSEWWQEIDALKLGSEWRDGVGRWARRGGWDWLVNEGVVQSLVSLSPFFLTQIVKLGSKGVLTLRVLPPSSSTSSSATSSSSSTSFVHSSPGATLRLTYHAAPTLTSSDVVSTTGAGDSLVGAMMAGLAEVKGSGSAIGDDATWERMIERGQMAARESLGGLDAVGKGVGQGERWSLVKQ